MWKWLEQYFTFTQSEKNGIIALVLLTLIVLVSPSVYLYFKPVESAHTSKYDKEIDAFVNEHSANSDADSAEAEVVSADASINKREHGNENRKEANSSYVHNEDPATFSLDINTADSTEFEKLKGIGPVLGRRIVKYRNLLGGYASKEQIKEVWGISDSTYQNLKGQFKVKKGAVTKININTAEYKELSKHPYIRPVAKAIVKYRKENGDFGSVADLKGIETIPDSTYKKMEPYLTVK